MDDKVESFDSEVNCFICPFCDHECSKKTDFEEHCKNNHEEEHKVQWTPVKPAAPVVAGCINRSK